MPCTATCTASAAAGLGAHRPLQQPGAAAPLWACHARACAALSRRHLAVRAFQPSVPDAAGPAPAAAAAPKVAPAAKPAEIDHVPLVLAELAAKKKVVIAQTAPAVRIAIGEDLGLGPGVNATGKMVGRCCWALRVLWVLPLCLQALAAVSSPPPTTTRLPSTHQPRPYCLRSPCSATTPFPCRWPPCAASGSTMYLVSLCRRHCHPLPSLLLLVLSPGTPYFFCPLIAAC
jgi:hypothetical protein